ncbi:DNA polymerase III subunit chi [Paracoccus sanguinis]|uniref:DNA polymerase III subunit chi n=1 Tax=Paracoccus sanguinis TaxID=1545044 RepID=UPI00051F9A88|nr:DNA polymerase III subunit chi [Paracoccus sanguinis]KGJ15408.1 DNA polymerase III subunit chi [Paracoccus sanguinis]
MGSALFYHLTRSAAEQLLPGLIGKSRAAGWRVELRGTDAGRMARLDEALWQGEGFLPHGLAGGPHDALQPVLLTVAGGASAGAACLIALDGAAVEAAECGPAERVCIVFDGNDPSALEQARGQWRALTGAGVAAEYWSEEDGRWARKR